MLLRLDDLIDQFGGNAHLSTNISGQCPILGRLRIFAQFLTKHFGHFFSLSIQASDFELLPLVTHRKSKRQFSCQTFLENNSILTYIT